MGNGHGGSRAGAGRKARAVKHLGPIASAEQRIADGLPKLIDNMFLLAEGVVVEKPDAEGGVNVFRTPPDRMANEYLINRIMGRPTQAIEVGGMDGEPIPVCLSSLPTESLNDLARIAQLLDNTRPEAG